MKKLLSILIITFAFSQIENSIVKIYTTATSPTLLTPWTLNSPHKVGGTGFIIEGNRILTNAHIVAYATNIQVRKNGEVKRVPAAIEYIAHQVDLAILTIDDPMFFKNTVPLAFGDLPEIQDKIVVAGYPMGGDEVSYSLGIVSRIETQRYSHSLETFLMIQVDAAINPGNSGGPAFLEDKVIGVATQGNGSGENIGYLIPTPIIRHLLKDVQDGIVDGFPTPPFRTQKMENPMLRNYYNMNPYSDDGVLVFSTNYDDNLTTKIQIYDILLAVDGHKVFYNSKVKIDGKLYHFSRLIADHQIEDDVLYTVLRNGEKRTIKEKAIRTKPLIEYRNYSTKPGYYVYGGFVFSVLNRDYFDYFRQVPSMMSVLYGSTRSEEQNEIIVLQDVLTDDSNIGYWENDIVTSVNGQTVKDFGEFIHAIESAKKWIKLEFSDQSIIIIDKELANKRNGDILERYNVPFDRSENLR